MAGLVMDGYRFVPPTAAQFATLVTTNGEASTPLLTDRAGSGLNINFGNSPAASDNVRMALRSKTAGASQSIIMRHQPSVFTAANMGAGLALRESSSGKIVTFGLHNNGLNTLRWTNPTTFSAQIGTLYVPTVTFEWLKITLTADDPSQFFVSRNGVDWHKVFATASQSAFFTFDQVGFYLYSVSGGVGVNGDATTSKIMNNILYYSDAGIVPAV